MSPTQTTAEPETKFTSKDLNRASLRTLVARPSRLDSIQQQMIREQELTKKTAQRRAANKAARKTRQNQRKGGN